MELHERANAVRTREDLVAFVEALLGDLQSDRDSWENPTLERFLDALAAWLQASPAYYANQGRSPPQSPAWRDVADMLMAAKIYE